MVFDAQDDGFTQLFRVPVSGGAPARLFDVKDRQLRLARAGRGRRVVATYVCEHAADGDRARSTPPPARHALLTDVQPRRARRARSAEARALLVHREERQADPQRDLLSAAARSLEEIPAARHAARRTERDGQRQLLDALEHHLLTSPGYVLLPTNYTGSTGFGEKFADDIERDVLRGPAQEILEGGAGSDRAVSVHRSRRGRPRSAPATAAT